MNKTRIGNNVFMPMPMSIVGAMNGDAPNFMAVGWITRANANPPMLAAGINRSHLTHDCIVKTGSFSVNIPGEELLAKTDRVGLVSGRSADKSGVFDVFYGENRNAPLIREAFLCLECVLRQAVGLPTNTLFIGEITGAWCNDDCLLESGSPDYRKARAFMLTMPDNSYLALGEYLGRAWSVGKEQAR
jgi:flavin reductase (DIM6/NTAB) family NADH-FMN oxidoreductase RutF